MEDVGLWEALRDKGRDRWGTTFTLNGVGIAGDKRDMNLVKSNRGERRGRRRR